LACVEFYPCDLDTCDLHVLIMYGDMIVFIGCHRQLMMWCQLILARDVDLRDVGVWQDAYDPGLCSFIFTGGHYS
jgi:hypothetical protein